MLVDIHATKAYKVKREEGGGIRLVAMKWVSVVNGPIDSRNLQYHFIPEQSKHKSCICINLWEAKFYNYEKVDDR